MPRANTQRPWTFTTALLCCGLAGCYLAHKPGEGDGDGQGNGSAVSGGDLSKPLTLPSCERSPTSVDARSLPVDMLFVVDNSQSMAQEQASLASELPRLMQVLTTGDLDNDGQLDFPKVRDLHVGVVSTDMGIPRVEGVPSCDNGLGDNGVLRHESLRNPGCAASYPPFLSYVDGEDATFFASDFGCVAVLGTTGCGFEQPLEAGLKALWPASDTGIDFQPDSRIGGTGPPERGHGGAANGDFLRPNTMLVVVMVTDEEDCSTHNTEIFVPPQYLAPGSPYADQAINLRCFHAGDRLLPVERYIGGLRALRGANPQLVMFAAIVGVPGDLVDARARAEVDFSDAPQREAYYERMLDDGRMQERIDLSEPEPAKRNLVPSCETDTGRAFPPRRIVELARSFGENGVVQSICQEDFGPAMRVLTERLAQTLTLALCLEEGGAFATAGLGPDDEDAGAGQP